MVFTPKNVRISINDAPLPDQDDNNHHRISRISNTSRKINDGPCTPETVPLSVFPRDSCIWPGSDTRSEASFGCTPLHAAATEGDQDTVRSLLMSAKTDVNAVDGDGWTSLHMAVKGGHIDLVKTLISDLRININCGGGYIGCTPLHLAALGGHHDTIKLLLMHNKININAMDKNGSTALHILTKESCKRHGVDKRYLRCIKALMENPDLKVNKPDMYGHTALSHALRNGNKETVRTIIQYNGAHRMNLDTSAADEMKTVRESILILFPEFKSILPPPLLEDINSTSPQTRLLAAIQHDNLDVFRDTLKKTSVNVEHWYDEPYYCTCLELACNLEGRHKFAQILVDSGANVNTVNPVSDVPLLHMAAKRGNLDQLNVLLSTERIDLNIKDCCQRTALHCLARLGVSRQDEVQGLQQSLALILEGECSTCRMIDLDAMDEWGNTALHVASRYGNNEMVDVLLRNGADINAVDGCGETALHIAARDGNQETVVTLMKHGADLMFTKFRQPPLAQIDRVTLRRFFDECLETNDKTPQHQDFRLTFNYNFLAPKNNRTDKKLNVEMPVLLYMSQDRRLRHMLKHPVVTSFLYLKWSHARSFFYMNLIFYTVFLCFLTAHVILTDYSVQKDCNKRENCIECANYVVDLLENKSLVSPTNIFNVSESLRGNSSTVSDIEASVLLKTEGNSSGVTSTQGYNETVPESPERSTKNINVVVEDEFQQGITWGLTILVMFFALRELLQFLAATKQYLRTPIKLLRIVIITLTTMLCTHQFDNDTNHHSASIVILLAWFEFLMRMGCLPACSILMQMLQTVSWTFVKYMSFYLPILIAFSLCFFTMLRRSCGIFFLNVWMSMMKSVLMLNGEYEASEMTFRELPVTSHIIMVVFILLVCIILLNLLSGLAVSDTQAIKNDAETLSLIARVRLISNIENLVSGAVNSKWILPRLITILTPNHCSVFKCFPDKQVHVFPNRTKGYICFDDTEPRMNTAMSKEIVSNALKNVSKKTSTRNNDVIQGTVLRAWGNENGALVSRRVKDLCEQQEMLTTQVRELKEVNECKLTRVEEEMRNALGGVVSEVGVKYDLLNANQEKIGKELAEKKTDIREVLCKSQNGIHEELLKHTDQISGIEIKLAQLEETVKHTKQAVDNILSLLLQQQRNA